MVPYIFLDLFFAMSGFLITRIIILQKAKGIFSFKLFYYKRAIRIFPVYYLLIILVSIFISTKNNIYPIFYLSNYFFIFHQEPHPLMHTWSLSVEEHFYLLWPVILMLFNLKTSRIIIGYIIPAICLLTIISFPVFFDKYFASSFLYNSTITRCLAISLGSFLAFHENWMDALNRTTTLKIAGLCFLIYFSYLFYNRIPLFKLLPRYLATACFIPVLSALTIIITHKINFIKKSIFQKLLLNGIINYVGKISYGLYLFHYPIFFYFKITNDQIKVSDNISLCIAATFLSIALASFSFHFFELPLINHRSISEKYHLKQYFT